MNPLQQFLDSMLKADVALQVHGVDTAASRAYRALLHMTTEAGHLAFQGQGPKPEWRDRINAVLDVLCPTPSPFLREPARGPAGIEWDPADCNLPAGG